MSNAEIQASTINAQLVIEQAELTDGIPCMWADQGSRIRVAYDPQQIDENAAKAVVILKVGDARRKQLHAEPTEEQAAETFDRDKVIAALPEIVDQSTQTAIPHRYSPELAAQFTQTMTGILTGALCPVWPTVCTETTVGHYDHFNHDHKATDKRGQTLLDVTFTQFSDEDGDGPPRISLGGLTSEDYDPSEVRAATAEIRRLLDQADAMADQVTALRP